MGRCQVSWRCLAVSDTTGSSVMSPPSLGVTLTPRRQGAMRHRRNGHNCQLISPNISVKRKRRYLRKFQYYPPRCYPKPHRRRTYCSAPVQHAIFLECLQLRDHTQLQLSGDFRAQHYNYLPKRRHIHLIPKSILSTKIEVISETYSIPLLARFRMLNFAQIHAISFL